MYAAEKSNQFLIVLMRPMTKLKISTLVWSVIIIIKPNLRYKSPYMISIHRGRKGLISFSLIWHTNLEKKESGTQVRVCLEVLNLSLYIHTEKEKEKRFEGLSAASGGVQMFITVSVSGIMLKRYCRLGLGVMKTTLKCLTQFLTVLMKCVTCFEQDIQLLQYTNLLPPTLRWMISPILAMIIGFNAKHSYCIGYFSRYL